MFQNCCIFKCNRIVDCPNTNWTYFEGNCYQTVMAVSSSFSTTYDARKSCLDVEADLPTINSTEAENFVASMLRAQVSNCCSL